MSHWDCTLEDIEDTGPALRLGLRQIKGLRKQDVARLVTVRDAGNARPFSDADDLWRRSGLSPATLERLAHADAWGSTGLGRRQAQWEARRLPAAPLPLFAETGEGIHEPDVALPTMVPGEEVSHDYASIRLSLKAHPLALLRADLDKEGVVPAARLGELENGKRVTIAGLVITRQRPGTASGVIFATLEDESGIANIIVWPKLFERYRKETLASKLLVVTGELQREGIVIHVIAQRLQDRTEALLELADGSHTERTSYKSRDFH